MSDLHTAATTSGYLVPPKGIFWRAIIGFELGWLALVIFQSLAIVPALAYWLYAMYRLPTKARLAVLLIAAAGIVTDALLSYYEVIAFSQSLLLPAWFLVLWALFALAAVETMAGFLQPWWLGLFLGAIGGPLSYLGGAALSGGVLQFPLASGSFVVLVAVWGVLGVILGYSRRFYAQTGS
ncbi:hypothetical protein WG68_09680 [Arsukibacterium ikkense]|uniref:DUF2878 domain-containing protein n=1 Tax=Arsukibacterium ikkense TaxID=336831 RepID=A0A0M2V7K2_9GAMM|nr:DUF2878 family protein [Arsukibacterium ikkense]KKO45640.1 hypothetical protein WG68_09680 [Arsukibacterium ikkense]